VVYKKYFFCITILVLLAFFVPTNLFASNITTEVDPICELNLTTENENIFEADQEYNIWKQCSFPEPTNLRNKLIFLELLIDSSDDKLIFSLIDSNQRQVSSHEITNWYDIPPDKVANLAIDPLNFNPAISGEKFSYGKVSSFQVATSANDPNSIILSNPILSSIENYPNYSSNENLPVQDPFPGFLFLIVISFPIGFVLLHYSGFQKEQNFVVKIPWFLGFGFVVYLLYSFIISRFWISAETILIFLITEYVIFGIFLFKNNKQKFISKIESKKTIFFFIAIFLISGYVSVEYSQALGWPTGWDIRSHIPLVSLGVEKHSFGVVESFLPIHDLPYYTDDSKFDRYPLGSHAAASGITYLTNLFPAVAIQSILSFTLFLIPCMLTSIVYKYTNSIFFSSLMFMFTFWRPMGEELWWGDPLLYPWFNGTFPGQVGVIVLFVTLVVLIEFFEKDKKKLELFILFIVGMCSIFAVYTGFLALPILIGIIGFTLHYVKNKRKFMITTISLATIFLTLPLYSRLLLDFVFPGRGRLLIYSYHKIENSGLYDITSDVFPYVILLVMGVICASYLIRHKTLKYFSLIFLVIALVHLLSLNHDLASGYFFYHKVLRSLGFIFLFSIAVNLIFAHFLFKNNAFRFHSLKFFKGKKLVSIKILAIIFVVILLAPTISTWNLLINEPRFKHTFQIPGGNEKNLQFWLYENTNKTDVILTDYSLAAEIYVGLRAQPLPSGNFQWQLLAEHLYDKETKKIEFKFDKTKSSQQFIDSVTVTFKADQILNNAWDYDYIKQTLKELNIDYVYISERKNLRPVGVYPDHFSWQNYIGQARIAMYENHPNLELILRNGNSGIFKVI